jgi:ADP-ribose pyrophosphatase
VAVVPVHEDGSITLLEQFRPAVGGVILEIPAGTRDVDGEPPDVTARRELGEEAGLEADAVEHLASVYNSPGFTDQRTEIYMATGLHPGPTNRSGVEERWITLRRVPATEIDALLAQGPVDETTLLAVRLAREALARRR